MGWLRLKRYCHTCGGERAIALQLNLGILELWFDFCVTIHNCVQYKCSWSTNMICVIFKNICTHYRTCWKVRYFDRTCALFFTVLYLLTCVLLLTRPHGTSDLWKAGILAGAASLICLITGMYSKSEIFV